EILTPVERSRASNGWPKRGLPGSLRFGIDDVEEIPRVKGLVPDEVVEVSMPCRSSRFGGDLHRARGRAPVLSAVVRGQHLHFLNRIQAGINHEGAGCAVQPRVQNIAAVDFERVVLDPAPFTLYLTLPTTPTLASSCPVWLLTPGASAMSCVKLRPLSPSDTTSFCVMVPETLEVSVSTSPAPPDVTFTSV